MIAIFSLLASLITQTPDVSCAYLSKSQEGPHKAHGCVTLENGLPVLSDHVLSDLLLDEGERGLGQVHMHGFWHWVRTDGYMLAVLTFDNGADPFSESLTRGAGTVGIAYYNRELQRILDLPYAYGMPFREGYALVCEDCRQSITTAEHSTPIGDTWGVIDPLGREVVAPKLKFRDALETIHLLP